jgi:hypothetical protein
LLKGLKKMSGIMEKIMSNRKIPGIEECHNRMFRILEGIDKGDNLVKRLEKGERKEIVVKALEELGYQYLVYQGIAEMIMGDQEIASALKDETNASDEIRGCLNECEQMARDVEDEIHADLAARYGVDDREYARKIVDEPEAVALYIIDYFQQERDNCLIAVGRDE